MRVDKISNILGTYDNLTSVKAYVITKDDLKSNYIS